MNTHFAYFDESNWNKGQYRAISMISMHAADYVALKNELTSICSKHKSEIKWSKSNKSIGINLIDFVFDNLHRMRVDILIWNINDSRHGNVQGRDDQRNLQRLYYRLMFTVMRDKWPDNAEWILFPDKHELIDWEELQAMLLKSKSKTKGYADSNGRITFSEQNFESVKICPRDSKDFEFIQLADFFAGIACYSHCNADKINYYYSPDKENALHKYQISERDKGRMPLVKYVDEKSKENKAGVYFRNGSGLMTLDPKKTLNFWLYCPQHFSDKAPQKKKA